MILSGYFGIIIKIVIFAGKGRDAVADFCLLYREE